MTHLCMTHKKMTHVNYLVMSVSQLVAEVGWFVEYSHRGVALGVLPLHHLVAHLGDSCNILPIDLIEAID